MQLAGSCFCGAVRFTVESRTPYPYRRCYCARCRKTAGGTGAAANVLAQASTLEVTGADALTEFAAPDTTRTRFCSRCGSALYLTIDAVVAELGSGSVARATLFPLAPAQVDGSGFVLALPPETGSHSLVALAADGTELGRVEYEPNR